VVGKGEPVSDHSTEAEVARAVSARLTERGPFSDDDCIMLIGSTVVGFGHARSDLDLLVSGPTPDRVPFHTFAEDRRVDVDFLYPHSWAETKGRVNACARSVTEPYDGSPPAPVEDRDWWSDHLWLYDRVVHGVPITERTAAGFLQGATPQSLATAIENYSLALCARMMQRARMHLRTGTVEAACQYECEALLAAVEAVAAARGLTFWSDRTILEKARRVQTPADSWDAEQVERLFADLVRRAWGGGADRTGEVPGVLRALLGPQMGGAVAAAGPDEPTGSGRLEAELADGWKAHVVSGEGFLLAPDRSLHRASPAVARFLVDRGGAGTLAWSAAAVLAATGALRLEPGGPVRPAVQPAAEPLRLLEVCGTPVAPSPESWLSSRISAQWNAMTVWSLSDDLHGAVESGQRNRVVPILRKAELFLRMMAMAVKGVRSDVTRSDAMDLQGCTLEGGFQRLLDAVYSDRPEDFRGLPELAVSVFSATMADCGLPARADMFERSRSFMKQLGDVRMWFRIAEAFDVPVRVPDLLMAKGAGGAAPSGSSVFVDAT
jgi:predicted nucleotidyltransferase